MINTILALGITFVGPYNPTLYERSPSPMYRPEYYLCSNLHTNYGHCYKVTNIPVTNKPYPFTTNFPYQLQFTCNTYTYSVYDSRFNANGYYFYTDWFNNNPPAKLITDCTGGGLQF